MKSNRVVDEIQVRIIYSCAILVTVKSEWVKTWTGTLANSADLDQTQRSAVSDQGLHCLLPIQEGKDSIRTVLRPHSGRFSSLHPETFRVVSAQSFRP